MNDYILFKNLDDKYLTLPELLVKEEEKKEDTDAASDVVDKNGNIVGEPIVGAITAKKQAETLQKLIDQAIANSKG